MCVRVYVGGLSLYSQSSLCFLGKHSARGQGSVQRGIVGGWWCLEGISCPGQCQPPPPSPCLSQDLGVVHLQDVNNVMSSHREGKRNIQEVHYRTMCGSMRGQQAHTAPAVLPPCGLKDTVSPR